VGPDAVPPIEEIEERLAAWDPRVTQRR
jgi:hypothetical protein